MLAPTAASSTAVWPAPGDASDLQQIVWQQAKTISDQSDLIESYQQVLENAQAIPPATGVGTSGAAPNTKQLTLTGVVGAIVVPGAAVAVAPSSSATIPPGTVIVTQQSGTPGGAGVYTVNNDLAITAVALTFTPGGGNSPWPTATDSDDLMLIAQDQTAIIRTQMALLQQYQDLLNASQTQPPPPAGP